MVRYAVSAVYLDPLNNAQNHGGQPMKATYTNNAAGSVAPFISGSLATQSAVENLTYGFIGSLGDILDELVEEATLELQDEARNDTEWAIYAPYLRVDLEDGELSYGYTGNEYVAAGIADLEYGDLQTAPSPLIRSFARQNRQEFADAVSDRIEKELDFG